MRKRGRAAAAVLNPIRSPAKVHGRPGIFEDILDGGLFRAHLSSLQASESDFCTTRGGLEQLHPLFHLSTRMTC
jgi:hypothetical protein